MSKTKQPKILVEGVWQDSGQYVRAWKEGHEYVVQVWGSDKPVGDPVGDWAMPGTLGLQTSVVQAVAQSPRSSPG